MDVLPRTKTYFLLYCCHIRNSPTLFLCIPDLFHYTTPMKKHLSILLFLLIQSGLGWATHIRGGYITAKRISGYKYEFVLTIFKDKDSEVINEFNNLVPDANASDVLTSRFSSITDLPGTQTEIWIYRYTYTYKSPGLYTAYHYQENRNPGVLNMDNSINTNFYVETKVLIDPFLDFDQTPVITKPAVDFAALGSIYRYNPGAYDPDGDSISYELVPSRQFLISQGVSVPVSNYKDPAVRSGGLDSANSVASFTYLNPLTGDLIWNVPRVVGQFNTAIKIIQWRKLRASRPRRDSIGYVLLDIQIIVKDTRNRRPLLSLPKDTCVVAGSQLNAQIFATDPDIGDRVTISFTGELDTILPINSRARFDFTPSLSPPFYGDFSWNVKCSHVRRLPYQAVFSAKDIPVISTFPPLTDTRVWRIKVVGPAPILTTLKPNGNGRLRLAWKPYTCTNANKILIYRRINSATIVRDTCDPGMPEGNGYVKIAEVSASDTTYFDDNEGKGLKKGPTYCYRIVAAFPEPAGGESLVSDEICQPLELDIPVLVNVDVEKTSATEGQILVRWTKPFKIDSLVFQPPYQYQLMRFTQGEPPVMVTSTADLSDTTFVDQSLNTISKVYSYQLRFKFGDLPNLFDSTEKASSVRLDLQPGIQKITLKWSATVPWNNDGFPHLIYRKIDNQFVLIDQVTGQGGQYSYTDEGKFNNQPLSDTVEYCYRVLTTGSYGNPQIRSPLENFSQEACATPTDTIKPCPPPEIVVQYPVNFSCSDCEWLKLQTEFNRRIQWRSMTQDTCALDVIKYQIYFTEHEEDPLQLIATVTDTFFLHQSLTNLAGCYAVTAIDRSGNESFIINKTCVDNCVVFDLPNLITPNGDGFNDVFTPLCVSTAFIEKVHFTVYNRWGKRVFDSDVEPAINWSGRSESNNYSIGNGVYFYHAKVKAKRLRREDEDMNFKGWILVEKN